MHHLKTSRDSHVSRCVRRPSVCRQVTLTLRFKELQLSVEELQVWLGEDDLRHVVLAGAATDIARLGLAVSGVNGLLRGVVDGSLCRHCVSECLERRNFSKRRKEKKKKLRPNSQRFVYRLIECPLQGLWGIKWQIDEPRR